MKNNFINIFLIISFVILSQQANAQVDKLQELDDSYKNPITDLPKELGYKYGKAMIPDKEIALEYADLILKKRYRNIPFDELKPYIITLIADERVWEIKVPIGDYADKYFLIRINKNNGEILNCWEEGK